MAKSKELEILWDIANLKKASSSVLRELYNNPLAKNLQIQRLLAWNQNISEDVLQNLTASNDTRVLSALINNPSANTSVFERLENNSIFWKDENIGLQRSLAEKPNISRKLIEKLASSNDRKILETFYYDNPSVPSDLKEKYRLKLGISSPHPNDIEPFQPKIIPQPSDISNNPFSKNTKTNCTGKNIRNNLIGGAAGVLGFFLGGPIGAVAAYGTVTGSLETITTISGCQI